MLAVRQLSLLFETSIFGLFYVWPVSVFDGETPGHPFLIGFAPGTPRIFPHDTSFPVSPLEHFFDFEISSEFFFSTDCSS